MRSLVKQIPADRAKEIVLDKVAAGATRKQAMDAVQRSVETYRDWCKNDPVFKARVDSIRVAKGRGVSAVRVPPFPEFAERYLRQPVPLHQLRAWDVLEGVEPRGLHPSMQYVRGEVPGRFTILNFPPDHAKSTTWTVNWVTWLIVNDPNVRVLVVSKTEQLARKFLSAVKSHLTSSMYHELQAAFAPNGGWRDSDASWRENMIYVRGRDHADPHPTVQTLGIGSQIYGSRADVIVLDDVEDFANVGQYDKHSDWISREVISRLEPEHGRLLVVGTRVAPMDLYRYMRDSSRTMDGEPFYTYFAQPAILENAASHYSQWSVLWPERMHARALANKKAAFTNPRRFELVYQQNDISDDAPFPTEAVQASVNRQRFPGLMDPSVPGHRKQGMNGLYIVAGLDPATVGATAVVVLGICKLTGKRYILDAHNKRGATPQWTIDTIKQVTEKYRVKEWRIERNAFQRFLTQLPEVKDWLGVRGVTLREHNTHNNKWDEDWGVETLIPLFLSCVDTAADGTMTPRVDTDKALIELPDTKHRPAIAELVNQLQVWEPEMSKATPTDLIMALWFAECGVKQYLLGSTFTDTHLRGKFVSRATIQARTVMTMDDLVAAGEVAYG
jgi:hypothetical protein